MPAIKKEKGGKKDGGERKRKPKGNVADWGGADPSLVLRIIEVVAAMDGAVRFGYSRDGGAYCIGIYGDGKPFTEYREGNSDVDEWLEGIRVDYDV